MAKDIPNEFWRSFCEDADYPMACIDRNNQFVWANIAYQKLLGYSIAELTGRTWMSITDQEYVGGDLASVQALLHGKISSYTMFKKYIHKRGFDVPIQLTVTRFPRSATEELLFFQKEASPPAVDEYMLEELEKKLTKSIEDIQQQIKDTNKGVNIVNDNRDNGDTWQGGDKVGRDKLTNSDLTIRYLIGGLVIIAVTVSWAFYYLSTTQNGTKPVPPSISNPINAVE